MGIFDWLFGKQGHPDNKINKNGMNVYFENIRVEDSIYMNEYKNIRVCRLKVNKKDGRRNGKYESFDRQGNKIITGNYLKGKLHGEIKQWRHTTYNRLECCTIESWENGYLKKLKHYSRNGDLIRDENFEHLTLEKGIIHIEIEQMDKFLNLKEEKPYETTINPD
jgi:antitoxin component YwqK of YwqJK toxin-antitoxin module